MPYIKPPNCKTLIGEKTSGRGYDAEVLVKEKLWRYGYCVKHQCIPFDLLVDKKFRVEVKSSKPRGKKGLSWSFERPLPEKYDILALVFYQPLGSPEILFFRKEDIEKIPGKWSISIFTSSKEGRERIKIGHKSPYEVFGKPRGTADPFKYQQFKRRSLISLRKKSWIQRLFNL